MPAENACALSAEQVETLDIVREALCRGETVSAAARRHGKNPSKILAMAAVLRRCGVALPEAPPPRVVPGAEAALTPALHYAKHLLEAAAESGISIAEAAQREGLNPSSLYVSAWMLRSMGVALPAFTRGRRVTARPVEKPTPKQAARQAKVVAALRLLREAADAALLVETREMSVQDAATLLGCSAENASAEFRRLRQVGFSLARMT